MSRKYLVKFALYGLILLALFLVYRFNLMPFQPKMKKDIKGVEQIDHVEIEVIPSK